MSKVTIKNLWSFMRRRISALLIVSLVATGLTPALDVRANNVTYRFINEVEVDESLVSDGMFYMPYNYFDANENDDNNKYVFKVKRKGEDLKAEKVKLTMVDMTGKYGRDYTIKVIDRAFFAENVKNTLVSKSVEEYMQKNKYEEYNYSDAIVDGSILADDIMTDEEKENFVFTDDDKERIVSDAKNILDEYGMSGEIEKIDTNKNDGETQNESTVGVTQDEPEDDGTTDKTVSGFTKTDGEQGDTEESTTEESTTADVGASTASPDESTTEESTTEESTTEESTTADVGASTASQENVGASSASPDESTTEESTTTDVGTSSASPEETTTTVIEASSENTTQVSTSSEAQKTHSSDGMEEVTASPSTIVSAEKATESALEESSLFEASQSEIIYGDEVVEYEALKASMSITEAYEMITGAKSDRKKVIPDRSANTFLPNSLDDAAYMHDSIETIEEELKSAYVILNFKEGQAEKLIEISIINDKKYRGDRQIGFNLSSVDESQVAGAYSSLTLLIHEDEEAEPSYINFTKAEYDPKDGYITVEVERSGIVSGIATCMIDTEDITAKAGRDYSKVHAELLFGLGANKRTVKIPIVSKHIKETSTFKLKLQEAKGALIGDKDTATCTIRKSDVSFKYADPKTNNRVKSTDENVFGGSSTEDANINIKVEEKNNVVSIDDSETFGAGGSDYDLDSIILGEPLDLEKCIKNFKSEDANKNSNHYFINGGKGFHMYLENESVVGDTAYYSFFIDTKKTGYRYDTAGVQFDWNCTKNNSDITIEEYLDDSNSWNTLYDTDNDGFSRRTNNFWLKNDKFISLMYFNLRNQGGYWGKDPTINIESIRPILKMYKIILLEPEIPELIDENGQKVEASKYARFALTSIEGAKSDHTAVGWSGKTITVKLDNTINNPFYIAGLYIESEDGRYSSYISANAVNEGATSSFKIDEDFNRRYDNLITEISRPGGGGKNGKFYIRPYLRAKETKVSIVKDDRVDVKIWNTNPRRTSGDANEWEYHIGDVLHFNAKIKDKYANLFKCDGLNVYRVKPYSPEWITIRRPVDGSDYFPLDSEYSEIRVVPLISPKDNQVIVAVKKTDVDKFDKSYGFFANAVSHEDADYVYYYIESDGSKIVGRYFDIKAKCIDDKNAPVWTEANKSDVKYMQNEYYFLGSEQSADNLIYLTCEPADDKKYSVVGSTYFEEVPIGGKTIDRYWQPAANIGILLDETHYAYSDDKGSFAIMPSSGKNGYYNKFKIVSNGTEKYETVQLNQRKLATREYVIEYETGEERKTEQVYEVNANEILISNHNTNHPYVTGVKSLSLEGTSYGAVYINDNITILKASVQAKKLDGSNYTYEYTDENGTVVTANENVKRVEFLVLDVYSHDIKKVIEATTSNADKTEWTANTSFARGNYAEYKSGDRLYVRIVTDRKVGDGKGDDGSGVRKEVPLFNETTYQAISTSMPFIEEAEKEPYIVEIDLPEEQMASLRLPIIGNLGAMLNLKGMSFGITHEGDRVRFYFGKKLTGKGNRYDNEGRTKADNGNVDITLSNIKDEFYEMRDKINFNGKKRLGAMSIGVPSWTFEPIVGIYFEFMLVYNPSSQVTSQYDFTGGGGYFGGILDLKYTFYMLIYGIPFYIGGQVNLSLVAELGIAVDEGQHIPMNNPDQGFFDSLVTKSHLDFLIRAILMASGYVGVGIAGTIGVRGGIHLHMTFIWNPTIKKKYSNVRPVGFAVTGDVRFWIDAAFFSIPIPVYEWPYPLKLGYFEDIEKVYNKNSKSAKSNEGNIFGAASSELKVKPRFSGNSTFVANDNKKNDYGLFGGTYVEEKSMTIVKDVYDAAEPITEMYDCPNPLYGGDKCSLVVYLDDDGTQGDLDRTTLKYSIYHWGDGTWTEPKKVWEDSHTADFSPVLCTDWESRKILLAWAKRPDPVDENTPKADLLKKMEIYTCYFNCETEQFEEPVRMTTDTSYDYYPQLYYHDKQIRLYYLKNENVGNIETADDLLNNIQPEVNGAYLMYMLYDDPGDGGGRRWLRDYYYDYEFPSAMTEEQKEQFKNRWHGQRIQDLSIHIGGDTPDMDDPNIGDYSIQEISTIVASDDEFNIGMDLYRQWNENPTSDTFDAFWYWARQHTRKMNVCAYTVDEDGDVNTKNDTEIYLKVKCATSSDAYTVRVTHNSVPDMLPKLHLHGEYDGAPVTLFWLQNDSAIKMLDINEIVRKSEEESHASRQMELGEVSIYTSDGLNIGDKISNFVVFDDQRNNTYLVWQQSSGDNESTYTDESAFKQDLYIAGLVKSTDHSGEIVKTWTNPVRFTNNGKLNDLPTVECNEGHILFIDNQYNLKGSGDSYEITDSNLQATLYRPESSLEISSVDNDIDTVYDNGSIKYKTVLGLKNVGLFEADGFMYNGKITYGGKEITSFSGNTNNKVFPGNETLIGTAGRSSGEEATPDIYFTLTKEQQKHLDRVKVNIHVEEHSTYDHGIDTSRDMFDVQEAFSFYNLEGVDAGEYSNVTVEQNGDTFIVKGILKNSGNTDTNGNEKIYVLDQENWDADIASSDYINLAMGDQMTFEIPIDAAMFSDFPMGVKDLVVYVKNDEGKKLSDYEIAILNVMRPYYFEINDQKEVLEIELGNSMDLRTTYEPREKYKNATVLYSLRDKGVVSIKDNRIFGESLGSTKLVLTTKEFGGADEIEVNVVANRGGSGGSSSGGGGAGPALPSDAVINTTKVDITRANSMIIDKAINQFSWVYNPTSNKFKLNFTLNGQIIPATNGFYTIRDTIISDIAGNKLPVIKEDTYYFDKEGNMITGWVNTLDNKWYFFENLKTIDEGKMIIGWKKIKDVWYYFLADGTMLRNAITPDGFRVGDDGGYISDIYITN